MCVMRMIAFVWMTEFACVGFWSPWKLFCTCSKARWEFWIVEAILVVYKIALKIYNENVTQKILSDSEITKCTNTIQVIWKY